MAQNPQTPQRKKKPLTRAQKKLRYDIRRFSILGALGFSAIAVLVFAVFLIFLPFRLIFGGSTEDAVPSPSPSPVIASPSPSPEITPTSISLIAVGDNLIHSTLIEYGQQADDSYDFTDIYSYMQNEIAAADIACIQQETIYVKDPAEYSNYPMFGTPTEMADSLAKVGFDVVCHASNHTYDKLMTGINDTLEAWKSHPEVTVLGIHGSQADADTIPIIEKKGIKIAMFNYTYGVNASIPEEEYTIDFLWEENKPRIKAQLEQAQELADFIIVFMHEGDEDALTPNENQKAWAQFFADNHVGLVIGTHSHSVQPTDTYTGTDGNKMPIFYSLGNFVSSQKDTVNMLGGLAQVTITKDGTGTYVSDYSLSPLVTWIQSGGTVGTGYIFHTLRLEDYTEEMAMTHIREACMPEDFKALWAEIQENGPIEGP